MSEDHTFYGCSGFDNEKICFNVPVWVAEWSDRVNYYCDLHKGQAEVNYLGDHSYDQTGLEVREWWPGALIVSLKDDLTALRAQLAEAQAQIEVYKVACDGAAALRVMGEIMREEFDAAIKRTQAERDKFRAEVNRQARAALAEAEADTLDATERVILMRRDNQRAAAARRVAAYCRELRHQVDATAFRALGNLVSEWDAAAQPPAPATHTTTNKDKK